MKKLSLLGFLLGMFCVVGVVAAADKNDPTGTWKWKTKFGEKEFEQTLKIENKDGKVTGTISAGKGKDIMIEDGKFKNGELTFTVTRERKDMKITTKYSGKVSDDTIKGTATTDFNGKENKQEWDAKREK